MVTRRRPRRARTVVQLVAGLALIGSAGVVAMSSGQPAVESSADPAIASPTQFGAAANRDAVPTESPYRLQIPSLDVDAPIVSVDVDDDGVLGVPLDPAAIGWWAGGPVPGSVRGTTILAGHVNTATRGPGALKDLETLQPGDDIVVAGWAAEPVTFDVEHVVRYPRTAVPPAAFDQARRGRLAIVSCSELDAATGTYLDNLIVYASPAAPAPVATISFDPPRTDTDP